MTKYLMRTLNFLFLKINETFLLNNEFNIKTKNQFLKNFLTNQQKNKKIIKI